MKRLLILFLNVSFFSAFAQAPQFINYQAVLRGPSGELLDPSTTALLTFKIYNDATSPLPAYEEAHNITIPATRIVNLRIGQGTPIAGGFTGINWATGNVHYLVSVNGIALGSRIPFASVPYALNSAGSAPGYSSSANVTITANVIDLTNTGIVPGTFGSNSILYSTWPKFTVDSKGRLNGATEYTANIKGDISGSLDSQYVSKLMGTPLSAVPPVFGQVLAYNGTEWGPQTPTAVATTNTFVGGPGIGILGTPVSTIMVTNTGTSSAWYSQGNSGMGAVNFFGTTDAVDIRFRTLNTDRMVLTSNMGFLGINEPNPTNYLTVRSNTMNNAAIFGNNLYAISAANAHGVHGRSASTQTTAAGVFGESNSTQGVYGVTSSNLANGVLGINTNTSATSGYVNGVTGITGSPSQNAAGVFGVNSGGGQGVFGLANSTSASSVVGVYGLVTANTATTNVGVLGDAGGVATAVQGRNFGNGTAIDGWQSGSTTTAFSHAGRFRITGNGNNSPALFASTTGTGAALHAAAGSSTNSALALVLEQGHAKAIGSPVTTTVTVAQNGFGTVNVTGCINCNDVKGRVLIQASSTTVASTTGLFRVRINFNKSYQFLPSVVIIPCDNPAGLTCYVTNQTLSSFEVTFQNNTASGLSGLPTNFCFNYIVIE